MAFYTTTPARVNIASLYRRRPVVARLVADGIFGAGKALNLDRLAWPRPMTGRPALTVIVGGRR